MTIQSKIRIAIGCAALTSLVIIGTLINKPKPTVDTTTIPNTTTVTVPKVTEKVIKEYVKDPALEAKVHDLLVENSRLKLQVVSLSTTVATLQSSGGVGINGGTITPVVLPVVALPKTTMLLANDSPPVEYNFNDYRLSAKFSATPSFHYTLSQKFSVLGTHSRSESGKDYDLVTVYENTPKGLVKLDSQSLTFESDPHPMGWHVSPRIQGGVALPKSGVVALQWLRRGTDVTAEHSTVGFLSPALTIGKGSPMIGVIPVNWNLGAIKHSPFTNLWLGPTVGLDKTLGLVISATF